MNKISDNFSQNDDSVNVNMLDDENLSYKIIDENQSLKKQEAYWLKKFSDEIPALDIHTYSQRPKIKDFKVDKISFSLDKRITKSLKDIVKENGCEIYTILLAFLKILLSRYTGQEDISIRSLIIGKDDKVFENCKDISAMDCAIRSIVNPDSNFTDYIKVLQEKLLMECEDQNLKLEELTALLKSDSALNKGILYDVVFVFEKLEKYSEKDDLTLQLGDVDSFVEKFDLSMTVVEKDEELLISLGYAISLYEHDTIERIANNFNTMISSVINDIGIKLKDIEILGQDEKYKLLKEFNNTSVDFLRKEVIHELFEKQVEKTPNNIAIVFKDKKLTYRELNEKANALARTLKENKVGPDTIVGIMVTPSIEMLVGILAILKAGGAYLPIDSEYPQHRIEYMLQDSKTDILLTQRNLVDKINFEGKVFDLEDKTLYENVTSNLEHINSSNDLAYIIYTSGTTGNPKGVMIEHKSLVNLAQWHNNFYEITENDRSTKYAGFGFDASVWEIFPCIISGAALHIIPDEIRLDIKKLNEYFEINNITVSFMPTQICEQFIQLDNKSLRKLLTGGDKLKKFRTNNYEVINNYGPTENTVVTASFVVDKDYNNIPIGKPIYNSRIYILDKFDNLMPIGFAGELCVSGDGLARGYLNNEKLTLEKFVDNPYEPGQKMYRTGDLARWLPDGNIEFLGRIDHQVKVRGFRIELGEIENNLLKIEGINEAIVTTKDKGGIKCLCAYYVSEKEFSIGELREILKNNLPDYMIPLYFKKIDKIPITANGKIDMKALPDIEGEINTGLEYEGPRNELEKNLVAIWEDVLGLSNININANFFELGGHSLNAMDIISRIKDTMNLAIPLKELINLGTIKKLSNYVEEHREDCLEENYNVCYMDKENIYESFPLTGIQLAYLVGRDRSFEIGGIATKLTVEFEVDVDLDRFNLALQKLIDRHYILNTVINDNATQRILEGRNSYRVKAVDLSDLSSEEINSKILEHRKKMIEEDIEPSVWPLFRIDAFILNDKKKYFFMNLDPLICDDSSIKILVREFKQYYNDINCSLVPLEYSFRDYVLSLCEFKNSRRYKKDKEYWINKIEDFPSAPLLPMKCNPDNIEYPKFKKISNFISSDKWKLLKEKARQKNITMASLLCTAYAYVLAFWSNESEFAVNLTVFNRIPFHKDVKNMIGDFTTLMLLDINAKDSEKSFWSFAARVQDTLLEALEHRNYDGMDVIRDISKRNNISSNAVMPIVFTSVLSEDSEDSFDNLVDFDKIKFFSTRTSQVYIDNQVYEINGGLFITWDYVEQLFDSDVIETMFNQYISIIDQILYSDKVSNLKINNKDREIIEKYNDTDKNIEISTLHELFSASAKARPEKVALKYHDRVMTYEELDKKSNQVARYLVEKGVVKGDYIGVITKRSIETIINLLGVLKAGAAYIPIDPDYPEERRDYIKAKSNSKLFITKDSYIQENMKSYSSEDLDIKVNVEDMAYVIFTSGSTGNPKGVQITHGSAANTILDINDEYSVTEKDNILGISSLCFDLSVYDVFGALSSGATLVIIDDQRDVFNLKNVIEKEKITLWNSVPSIMEMLIDSYDKNEMNNSLRLVLLSGDWIPIQLPNKIKEVFHNSNVISLGGATEGSIWSIHYPIKEVKKELSSIPYGKPLGNQKFYILNEEKELCPVGVKGELYIGGLGVAKGYINDEEKTKAAFINHSSLGYVYKTGDYGVLREDGYIEFLGRKDSQIKIRGYRVELGEIENFLIQHDSVDKAVVLEHKNVNGVRNLYAYVVSKNKLDSRELSRFLERRLPKYMIPSSFIKVNKIPLTVNGKVDKKKLNELGDKEQEEKNLTVKNKKPVNQMQRQILEIWKHVFKVEDISIDTDYYELGADSLKIIAILTEINKKLNAKMPTGEIFKNQTIEDISNYLYKVKSDSNDYGFEKSIEKVNKQDYYHTSPAQKRMYMLSKLENIGASYHIPMAVVIEGKLRVDDLNDSLNKVLIRHEVLRTGFEIIDNELVQKVYDDVKLPINYRCADSEELIGTTLDEFTTKEVRKLTAEFDLSKPPLVRVSLVKIYEEKYILLVNFHHIIADGMSQEIFINDLLDLYNGHNLSESNIQYKDYVYWNEEYNKSLAAKKEEEYWINIFKEKPPKLNLPFDYKKINTNSFTGKNVYFKIGSKLSNAIKQLAKETGTTLYMVMLSAYYVLLNKYTDESDIVIGAASSGRFNKDLEKVFGMFVNTIALRNNVDAKRSFKELLLEVKNNVISSFEYSNYDFDKLIQNLDYDKEYGKNLLFDVMFAVEDARMFTKVSGELELSPILFNYDNSKFDITMVAIDSEDEITLNVEYSTQLFKENTINRLIKNYINILSIVSEDVQCRINEIDMISEEEKEYISNLCCGKTLDCESNCTIQELFEERVERTPNKIALVCGSEKVTYNELNKKANQLARKIREYNVKRDTIIGIMMDRSVNMIVGILGILKAGAAYLPIDADYPEERIRYIIEDSKTKIILTDNKSIEKINFVKDEDIIKVNINNTTIFEGDNSNLESINDSCDLAYIIYTSGSTGKPKGVMIEHKGIGNIKAVGKEYLKITDEDKFIQAGSISFDISVWEIFTTLLLGAELHVLSKDIINNYNHLESYIIENGITSAMLTPNYVANIDTKISSTLKNLITGGSAANIELVEKWRDKVQYVNAYGPTEGTICSNLYICKGELNQYRSVPIGKPISNTKLYILNKDLKYKPIGVVGELYISGIGLARGYLNRPELIKEKFIENPYEKGEIMYATGDLVRLLEDGNIEYIGRIDNQVKVRGYRIELGEIESQLMKNEQVKDSVVITRKESDGLDYIYGYIVPKTTIKDFDINEINEELKDNLPEYMIPSYLIPIERIPLTPNGKIDISKLPVQSKEIVLDIYEEPEDEIEEQLVSIWENILNITEVGITNNFFKLGGHSLNAIILVSRIQKDMGVEIPLSEIFKRPTIKEIAQYIRKDKGQIFNKIDKVQEKEYYDVSSPQKRIYILNQVEEGITYNIPLAMKVTGDLDIDKCRKVFMTLIERHESLRTRFLMIDEKLVQKIEKNVEFNMVYSTLGEETISEKIKEFIRPFSLEKAPLFRVEICNISENKNLILIDMHHIISDGVSTGILLREFNDLYSGKNLEPLKLQYKDYSEWEKNTYNIEKLEKEEKYWLNKYKDEVPLLNMLTDYPRSKVQSFEGKKISLSIDKELSESFKKFANDNGVTMYMLYLAGYSALLSRYTAQDDIVIGSPIAGRRHQDLNSVVGMFVNTLAIRNNPEGTKTFIEYLNEVKENCLHAYENQDYQFENLVEKLNIKRETSRNPLFDTMFAYENNKDINIGIKDLDVEMVTINNNTSKFDITITASELKDGTILEAEYSTNLYKEKTVERILKQLVELLVNVTRNSELKLEEINLIEHDEENKILYDFNNTSSKCLGSGTICELFEEQVEKTPNNIAVVFEDKKLSYRELNERSNSLARALRDRGVGPDAIVGIMVKRSIEMIVGIMAILKAGAAYLPIDSEWPEDRIAYMLKNSQTKVVLTQSNFVKNINAQVDICDLDNEDLYQGDSHNLNKITNGDNLAYIIYTSGTTGKPKGVMIEHKNVINLVGGLNSAIYSKYNKKLRVALVASYVFDASVQQIFASLLLGNELYIIPEEDRKDGDKLIKFYINKNIEISDGTPMHLAMISNSDLLDDSKLNIKHFIIGGDKLPKSIAEKICRKLKNNKVTITNVYGPTECCVDSSYKDININNITDLVSVPIGKPLENYRVYILNNNTICPIGIAGELCISGNGLARGYLNNEKLTSEKFIDNPYEPGQRMYKTGDLARWLQNGDIEFLGRIDNQVKIRGFRIELGEIESNLLRIEDIREAVVVDKSKGNDKYLCAYYVGEKEYNVGELREKLMQSLPDYMIPSYFVKLDSIPLTSSGKIDRKSLPEPGDNIYTGVEYEAPRNKLEESLIEIWQEVLGVKNIGINDNFFNLGGDSIKAIQVRSRAKVRGFYLTVKDLFSNPDVKNLSKCVNYDSFNIDQGEIKGYVKLTPIQVRYFNNKEELNHYNQSFMLYKKDQFDEDIIEKVFNKLIEHHDALRMIYRKDESGQIVQYNRGIGEGLVKVQVRDIRGESNIKEKIEKISTEIQKEINIFEGELVKVCNFKTDEGDHLLIVINHLVIDGVSWRILYDDIEQLYKQAIMGEELRLQSKSNSFKEYSDRLWKYVDSKKILKEEAYWRNSLNADVKFIPKKNTLKNAKYGDSKTLTITLNKAETYKLIKETNKAYNTQINDILLTALTNTVKTFTHEDKLKVYMEGHGRNDVLDNIDISRTVGWFTTIYPVLLDLNGEEELSRNIKTVKETLRKVPNNGLGYGVIRYLTNRFDLDSEEKIDILFNYLGEIDNTMDKDKLDVSKLSTGEDVGRNILRNASIEINSMVIDGELNISTTFNDKEYDSEVIENINKIYKEKLLTIVEHCINKTVVEKTPSDYGDTEITIDELARIENKYKDYKIESIYPLNNMQKSMLFHALKDKNSNAYTEQVMISIDGVVRLDVITDLFNKVINKHEALRSLFEYEIVDEYKQIVMEHVHININYHDIENEEEKDVWLEKYLAEDREKGFNLTEQLPTRISLIKLGKNSYKIVWTHHHILLDGWSVGVILEDVFDLLEKMKNGQKVSLEKHNNYGEYIKWLESQDEGECLEYWRNYLKDYNCQAMIPKLSTNMKDKEYLGKEKIIELSESITNQIMQLANRNKATVNTVIQCIWAILLCKYNNSEDVVFGSVISGRENITQLVEKMVGLFINTVPTRIRLDSNNTFSEVLQTSQNNNLESSKYNYLNLSEVQGVSSLNNNLINHIMVFENYSFNEDVIKNSDYGFRITDIDSTEQTNYDFSLVVIPGDKLGLKIIYDGNVYHEKIINNIEYHITKILEQVINNENIKISDIDIISEKEDEALINKINNTSTNYPKDKTISELFEEQVEKTPDNIAVVLEDQKLTYRELNEKANKVAILLREKCVNEESIVGIMVDRSLEMIIGIIGILKAGAGYLPIDVEAPKDRIKYMIEDSNVKILLTKNDFIDKVQLDLDYVNLNLNEIIGCKENLPRINSSDNAAYIIYTSGSTGNPKGVIVNQYSVVRVVKDTNYICIKDNDVILQLSNYSFDGSVFDIYGALLNGAKLVMLRKDTVLDLNKLSKLMKDEQVSITFMTTALFNTIVDMDVDCLSNLRKILFGGERVSVKYVEKALKHLGENKLLHVYGPTESTVYATYYPINKVEVGSNTIPIGKPLSNTKVYVLDRSGRKVPIGVEGELCIAGDGLSRGYLNNKELTDEKFVENRYEQGEKIYKTGDLVKLLPDGNIEFIGRIDGQVKIRGHRVELGEIENELVKNEEIRDVSVIAREGNDGTYYICAYIVADEGINLDNIKNNLSKILPKYMMPSVYTRLDKLPLTKNGKVDKKALPELSGNMITHVEYEAPRNDVEKKIADIWGEVLGKDEISINDNFFEIGGNSLKVMHVINSINKVFNSNLSIDTFFKNPTIKSSANNIIGIKDEFEELVEDSI